ncbi:MAG: exosortase family protein XrtF [Bacteroidetes bacterium]|nr:exosortase family protein XrtF [Bacteroidota bacterium]
MPNFKSPLVRFLLISSILYTFLFLIYQFVLKRYTNYDQNFIAHIINVSDYLLKAIGYKTFKTLQENDYQVIGIDGSNGVWIGSNCNAIKLFALFSVFIIAFPGKQKQKYWFILLGILSIHILNIIRVVALTIIAYYSPYSLDFNHTYTFTFIVYLFIFLLWLIWINKFSGVNNKEQET